MKRVLITCRVDVNPAQGERRDALDQRWIPLFESLGIVAIPVPNSDGLPPIANHLPIEGILLSGGNDIEPWGQLSEWAPERDSTERALLEFATAREIPVLGVCRGMQMMNVYLGGGLSPVSGHVRTRHIVRFNDERSNREVNSYHNLGLTIADLAPDLVVKAVAMDGTIEAIEHAKLPWVGIMWHPERDSATSEGDAALFQRLFRSL